MASDNSDLRANDKSKKPPLATRLKKGNTNPQNQRDGSKEMAALLREALDEPAAAESGRRRSSKRELVIRALVEKSTDADLAATKLLFDLLHKAEPTLAANPPADAAPFSQNALDLLKERLARLAHAKTEAAAERAAAAVRRSAKPPDGEDAA